jgi:hypothetical protein
LQEVEEMEVEEKGVAANHEGVEGSWEGEGSRKRDEEEICPLKAQRNPIQRVGGR